MLLLLSMVLAMLVEWFGDGWQGLGGSKFEIVFIVLCL
jgi:hypothetical protein